MAAPCSRDVVLSRRQIEALIAAGRKIVIVNGSVLKVDAWIPYHPGGDKAILHMVGRDATNEVKAFHSLNTQELMKRYCIGRVNGIWKDFVPPIQGGKFRGEEEADTAREASEGDSSGSSSPEPSPIFERAEYSRATRRRRGSDSAGSESSATSLETLAVKESTQNHRKASASDRITQDEIERDLNIFPSLDSNTQNTIVDKYKLLDQRLRTEGLYDCNYRAYAMEVVRYTMLGALSFYFLRTGWYALSAVFLGLLWHQLVFTVHDAGHMGITHNFQVDSCIGIFISNFLGGLSCCWWKKNHNVHHIVTNSAEHDPDIQHMPFFAVSHRFLSSLYSTYYDRPMPLDRFAQKLLQYQHYLYYPILTFGRFNLYVLSWGHIFLGQGPRKGPSWWHRYLEMAGQAFFWFWFGYLVVYRSIPTAGARHVRAHLPCYDNASPSADHAFAFCHVDSRSRCGGIIPSAHAPHDHGRRMSCMAGLHPWRSPVPSGSSPVPEDAETQFATSTTSREGILRGRRHPVCDIRLRRGERESYRQARGGRSAGQSACGMRW